MSERAARDAVVAAARRMSALGLNTGKSGNVSVRAGEGFLVTPSGKTYDTLGAGDLVRVHLDGTHQGGNPSSEWRLHRDIYAKRAEAQAIVHTHSPYATTLACLRRRIPAFHYEIAFAGGDDIRCAPYATFGTQELSDFALGALEGRKACLLANHGVVTFGSAVDEAVSLMEKVEMLSRLYWQAIQVAEPALLDEVEMTRIVEKFRHYGR